MMSVMRNLNRISSWTCLAVAGVLCGCSQVDRWLTPAPVPPLKHTPRTQTVPVVHRLQPVAITEEQPAQPADQQPEHLRDPLQPPYQLTVENIIRLVYIKSPSVNAAREEMQAALHGLEEFRANLNRFEPFVDVRSDVSDFPNRQGARGTSGEATAGIQKETFEGAILKAEGGASFSRFTFDDRENGDNVESGGDALLRARVEVPFFGSRRRQERVISQAFQESNARKAKLDYLDNYRLFVENALSYYHLTVYYMRLAAAYQRYIDVLDSLLNDQRLKETDRDRVESVRIDNVTRRDGYAANQREYLMTLLSESGISFDEEYELKVPPYRLSPYVIQAASPESLERLLEEARESNPTFRVLNDAIRDAELQRTQAIKGKYDVTAFVEGTQFPIGSETFDDRLDGWTVGAGLTFRLNDRRVLNATRLKAEAQIRQFHARIEAEETTMRRRIMTETEALGDNDKQRNNLLNVIEQKQEEFTNRLKDYFQNKNDIDIDRVLASRREVTSAEVRLSSTLYNSGNREARLMGAVGKVYEIVGLKIEDQDNQDPRESN